MMQLWPSMIYQHFNLLLLEEVLDVVWSRVGSFDVLFRVSEQEKLERIETYGTDRGGYAGEKPWRYSQHAGIALRHQDVIIATTEQEIRYGEEDASYSTSFKKLGGIDNPLLLIYDSRQLAPVWEKHHRFRTPDQKRNALIGAIPLQKAPQIKGWFSEREGLFYRSLARKVRSGTVIEVGAWKGRSTAFVGPVCRENATRLVCVDTWTGSSDQYDAAYRQITSNEDVPAQFRDNMAVRAIPVDEMHCTSTQAARSFAPESVDLVFLDASHDYHSVSSDVNNWFERIRANGVLAGHDFNDEHQGVTRAVEEFCQQRKRTLQRGHGSIWCVTK